jgi:hypothetical protein
MGGARMSTVDRKVTCLITGQAVIMGKDYFAKKAQEYGSEDNLKKYYVSKKARSLIRRSYTVNEIRKILNIVEPDLPSANDQSVKDLVSYHATDKQNISTKRLQSAQNFIMSTSDEDVKEFINNIRNLNL